MNDRLTPMEAAEVLELPKQSAAKQKDSYGTAAPKKPKKNHDALIVVLSVLAVVLGGVLALASLHDLHVSTEGGRLTLSFTRRERSQEDPGVVYHPLSPDDPTRSESSASAERSETALRLSPADADALSPADVYDKTAASVVCLTVRSAGGTVCGTGTVLTEDGCLLTSADLYAPAAEIDVLLHDGSVCTAVFLGVDTQMGLALADADADGLEPVELAAADSLRVGDPIYSVGNPNGSLLPGVFATGMVSAKQTAGAADLLQTTADFDGENSGCPVFNAAGQMVAMATTVSVGGARLNCAVTADRLLGAAERILGAAGGTLGFAVGEIPAQYLAYYGYPGTLWITEVYEGTVADGLLYPYDVITAVNDVPVLTEADFHAALAACETDVPVTVTLYRAGSWYRATLPLS